MEYHGDVNTSAKLPKQTSTISILDRLKRGGRINSKDALPSSPWLPGFPRWPCVLPALYDNYSAVCNDARSIPPANLAGVSFNLKHAWSAAADTFKYPRRHTGRRLFHSRPPRGNWRCTREVMLEVNDLGQTLRDQRLGALEATALLRTVMGEIDVAVFAFDGEERLRLVNRAGERLLAQPAGRLLGRTSEELGLAACLDRKGGEGPHTMQMVFPGGFGRWDIRRSTFREGGAQHQLLVLTDLSQTLREEERSAWQRLLRVLGHELNNSLAPIKSVAGSLSDLLSRQPRPADWGEDMHRGLGVISSRADSLARFVESYSKLARLPQPRFEPLNMGALVIRVASLETRCR